MAKIGIEKEVTKKRHVEETSIATGVLLIFSTIFFFLLKFDIIQIRFVISDNFFLYFFATLGLISGIIHVISTIGTISTH